MKPQQPLVTRYAPSPTGRLHLGHAAHILYVWGLADLLGARVLLRIEDHDRQRCRAEYEAAILEDLDWLGFEPANTMTADYRQSDSDAVYREALDRLRRGQNVYRCVCTRKDLAACCAASETGERIYAGRCRAANHPGNVPHGLRLEWGGGEESFEDGFLGPRSQDPARQCGDLLLKDRHGQWTYQFAVTVDDMRHGVNLIVRGEDLLDSTGRQIRLARLLGRAGALLSPPAGDRCGGSQAQQKAALAGAAGIARGRGAGGQSLGARCAQGRHANRGQAARAGRNSRIDRQPPRRVPTTRDKALVVRGKSPVGGATGSCGVFSARASGSARR